ANYIGDFPVWVYSGQEARNFLPAGFNVMQVPAPLRATAVTSGDFNGDGLVDIGFAAPIGGKPGVCMVDAAIGPGATSFPGWVPDPPPPDFATSLIACDLDADGSDELLVSSSAGVDIVNKKDAMLVHEHLDTPYGARLTTLHPGRPDPGVWAALHPDGS